jgi:hypothetical protein
MASARVVCPHCQAKLRLSTAGGAPTRAKCSHCRRSFTPTFSEPVLGVAVYLDAATASAPLSQGSIYAPGSPPDGLPAAPAKAAPAAVPVSPPPKPAAAAPVALASPPPPAPLTNTPPPPAAAPETRTEATPAFFSLSEPPPPKPVAATVAPKPAPAATAAAPAVAAPPKPARRRERSDDVHDPFKAHGLRPFELVLAGLLLLGLLVGGGLLAYQYLGAPSGPPAVPEGPDINPPTTAPLPSESELVAKPLPPQLFGTWDLRSDDERSGQLILRPDGTLTATSMSGNIAAADTEGHWYMVSQSGSRFALDFAPHVRSLAGYRVMLDMPGPDAFTLVETLMRGVALPEGSRFIRVGPPLPAKAAPGKSDGPPGSADKTR